jgi:hypothetical protein
VRSVQGFIRNSRNIRRLKYGSAGTVLASKKTQCLSANKSVGDALSTN